MITAAVTVTSLSATVLVTPQIGAGYDAEQIVASTDVAEMAVLQDYTDSEYFADDYVGPLAFV